MRASRGLRGLSKTASQCPHRACQSRPLSSLASTRISTNSATLNESPFSHTAGSIPSNLRQQRRHASTNNLKRTPLYDLHQSLSAKLVPFAEFSMPLEYPDQSHPTSHNWTRSHCSIFDVSHMVQHKLSGPLAQEFLIGITPSSIDKLEKRSSTLSCLLDSDGGIVDDTVITRLGRDSFYFVTNAGCRADDLAFIESEMSKFVSSKSGKKEDMVWHVLDHHSLIALQGPKAAEVLQPLVFVDAEDDSVDTDLSTLYFGHSRWLQLSIPETCTPEKTSLSTPSLLVSRTGYTGEDGFEISIPPEKGSSASLATSIVKALLTNEDCKMAGLAARDSLRLEAGMCLYGHDIDTSVTPPMAALGWVVPKARRKDPNPTFNGADMINRQLAEPKSMERRRVGFTVEAGPAAREGATVVAVNEDGSHGEMIGKITSGLPSPSLDGQNIAMGYVKNGFHKAGTTVAVKVRKNFRKAEVVKMPFVENKFYRG